MVCGFFRSFFQVSLVRLVFLDHFCHFPLAPLKPSYNNAYDRPALPGHAAVSNNATATPSAAIPQASHGVVGSDLLPAAALSSDSSARPLPSHQSSYPVSTTSSPAPLAAKEPVRNAIAPPAPADVIRRSSQSDQASQNQSAWREFSFLPPLFRGHFFDRKKVNTDHVRWTHF